MWSAIAKLYVLVVRSDLVVFAVIDSDCVVHETVNWEPAFSCNGVINLCLELVSKNSE